jgi:hypothetical protein
MRTACQHEADVVTGPVVYTFGPDVPTWVSTGGFFDREALPDGAKITEFFTCNVMIRLGCLETLDEPFDHRFGLTGGSDIFLSQQLARLGAKMVWSSEAVAYETVPASRATVSWLMRRWYRYGMIRTRIAFIQHPDLAPRIVRVSKCCVWLLRGTLNLLPGAVRGRASLIRALQGCAMAIGGIAGSITTYSYKEYNQVHGE